MLIKFTTLKERLHGVILNKGEQGYDTSGLQEKLDNIPESFDSILSFLDEIRPCFLPFRHVCPFSGFFRPGDLRGSKMDRSWTLQDPAFRGRKMGHHGLGSQHLGPLENRKRPRFP